MAFEFSFSHCHLHKAVLDAFCMLIYTYGDHAEKFNRLPRMLAYISTNGFRCGFILGMTTKKLHGMIDSIIHRGTTELLCWSSLSTLLRTSWNLNRRGMATHGGMELSSITLCPAYEHFWNVLQYSSELTGNDVFIIKTSDWLRERPRTVVQEPRSKESYVCVM